MLGFCLDNPATTPVCRPETVVFSPLMLLPGVLGVPTVADRVAQTVVARRLEAKVDPIFHPDSYGYRPGWLDTYRNRYNLLGEPGAAPLV